MSYPRSYEARTSDPTRAETPPQAEPTQPDRPVLDVVEGAEVRTSDGALLGTVAESTEQHFRVDVPAAPDFWLERSRVRHSDVDTAMLDIAEEDVASQRLERPPVVDSMLSGSEEAEQRAQMEAELASQRGRSRGN